MSENINNTDIKNNSTVETTQQVNHSNELKPNQEIEMKEFHKKITTFMINYNVNLDIISIDENTTSILNFTSNEMIGHNLVEFIEKDYLNVRPKEHLIEVLTKEDLVSDNADIDIEKQDENKTKNNEIITFVTKSMKNIDVLFDNIKEVDDGVYRCMFKDATDIMQRKRSDTYNYINSISSTNSKDLGAIGGYVKNSIYNMNWHEDEETIGSTISTEHTMSSTAGDIVIEMSELYNQTQNNGNLPKGQWSKTGLYRDGMEQSSAGITGYGAVSLNGFAYLRQLLDEGVVLLDEPCESIQDCVQNLLDKFEDSSFIDSNGRTMLEGLLISNHSPVLTTSPTVDTNNNTVESCKVFITSVPYISKPFVGLIRVSHPITKHGDVPIRYVLVIVGKEDSDHDYHDIGRAFSLMMAQNWFYSYAKKITSKHRFIKLMDTFLRRCVMLPPPEVTSRASEPDEHVTVKQRCCKRSTAVQTNVDKTMFVSMPTYRNMYRANNYLDKKDRILKEQEVKNMKIALQAEPTAAEIDDQQLPSVSSHLGIKDRVWGIIILILCVCVAVFLNIYPLRPYSDGLHVVEMNDYPMEMVGGMKSIGNGDTNDYEISQSPRGLYEVTVAIERSTDGVFSYQLMEMKNNEASPLTDLIYVNATSETEVEDLQSFDIADKIGDGKLFIRTYFTSASGASKTLSFVLTCTALKPLGRYRIIIGCIILVLVYALLLAEVVHRTVCAFIGAFLTLLLMSLTSSAPSLSRVITFIDSSTICLLFGMMIMVQTLSTTGLFEWAAVKAVKISGGRPLVLNIVLCLLTAILSAFLDNVTTMLLFAPVTIELCKVLQTDPIPFLIPEVLFSNIGGTSTMIGDPPNIMIGNLLGDYVSFIDFIVDVAPCCLIVMVFAYLYLYLLYHKSLKNDKHVVNDDIAKKYSIKNKPLLLKSGIILLTVIILLFLHTVHGIDAAYLTLAGAFSVLLLCKPDEIKHTLELLEWETLLFFAGLFVMIEGMNEMGVIRAIGDGVSSVIRSSAPESRLTVAILMILWVSGIASSILDNIPFTATIIPIILQLHNDPELMLPVKPLAWALSLGACLGGNGTLVGASANLVTAGIAGSRGYKITFISFLIPGYPTLFISMIIASIYLLAKYVWAA